MANPMCPQMPLVLLPLGIENQSTRTMAHAFDAFGLSRDGSLPKAIHEGGAPDKDGTQHFILYPGGKKVDLNFAANIFGNDRAALKCFESAIGFDRAHYEAKKDAVDQKTPLARFYQDQLLEVWDPMLQAKAKAKDTGPVNYKDQLKFWDNGIGDANTSTLNIAALQAILDYAENPADFVTVPNLIADHDGNVALMLKDGAMVCRAVDWGKTFYRNDQKEFKVVCERPGTVKDVLAAMDKDLPKEGKAVAPTSAQGVLDSAGYEGHKAVSKAAYIGVPAVLIGLAVVTGVAAYFKGRSAGKKAGSQPPKAPAPEPKKDDAKAPPKDEPKGEKIKLVKTGGKQAEKKDAGETKEPLKPEPAKPAPESADDMSEVLAEIAKAKETEPANQNAVTADNLIIEGDGAAPVKGIDQAVIHAQIAALLPVLMEPSRKRELDELNDRLVVAYGIESKTIGAVEKIWAEEVQNKFPIVRRGLPLKLFFDTAAPYLMEIFPEDQVKEMRKEIASMAPEVYKAKLLEAFRSSAS